MARPVKNGLDYFPLNCVNSTKLELLEAEFGLNGFAIVVKLLQKIYGEQGYYCEWTNEVALLFAHKNGAGGNAVSEIVNTAIKRGIFDKGIFNKYHVLTSSDIQKCYFEAVNRRKKIEVIPEYLLIEVAQNFENVYINSINVDNNSKNVCNNPQSKVKESKEKKNIISEPAAHRSPDVNSKINYSEIVELFNAVCVSLPQVKTLTDKRRAAIRSAYKLVNGDFKELFEMVEASDFLTGRNGNWNGCGFDWVLKSANITKILEGNYKNKEEKKNGYKSNELWEDTTGLYF